MPVLKTSRQPRFEAGGCNFCRNPECDRVLVIEGERGLEVRLCQNCERELREILNRIENEGVE